MYFPDRECVRPLRNLYGYAIAETLNSDKSDSNQQRSATLECFLQMLTHMRVPAFFLLQL